MDLIFYNQSGEPFPISEREWQELHSAAVQAGWRPAGTLRPAIPFDIEEIRPESNGPWSRGYLTAEGQTVQRSDARSLAAALRALERATPTSTDLAAYCERGGFLVCAGAGASVGNQLLSMNFALHESAGRSVATESHVLSRSSGR